MVTLGVTAAGWPDLLFFGPKSRFGLFSWSLGFFIFRKKAHKIWLFWALLKVNRKLLKFYLQNTNFSTFCNIFWSFWTTKIITKHSFCVVQKIFVSGCQICEKLVHKSAIKPDKFSGFLGVGLFFFAFFELRRRSGLFSRWGPGHPEQRCRGRCPIVMSRAGFFAGRVTGRVGLTEVRVRSGRAGCKLLRVGPGRAEKLRVGLKLRAVWPEGLSEMAQDFEKKSAKSAEIYKVYQKWKFFDEKEQKN